MQSRAKQKKAIAAYNTQYTVVDAEWFLQQ
jgi:hypothetical protein